MSQDKDVEVQTAGSQTTASKEAVEGLTVDWSPEEERQLVRKVDFIILAPLVLAFFALQLDRGNIGSALTDFFLSDVGISQTDYNNGNMLMSVGIVLLEIPSNLILFKLGPTIWIGGQIFAWGFVATFQAFQHGRGPWFATRLLLGLCESGFIPAGLYTLSRWYKHSEISKRFAIYFFGNNLATACSGLLAYGILRMRGIHGMSGWQWMFIIEGIYTLVVATVFIIIFPKSPDNPVSLFRIRLFSDRDAHILKTRVLVDDPSKSEGHRKITWVEFKRTITNWRLFSHIIIPLCALAPAWTFAAYAPYLVQAMGYGRLEANALCSVGGFILLPMNFFWGFLADKTRRRGMMVSIGLSFYLVFAIASREIVLIDDQVKRLPVLIILVAFSSCWHPVNCSWISLNARSAEERTVSMAIVTMCANLAGIMGSQLFQNSDAPYYPHGWTSIAAVVGVALAMSLVANAQYFVLNRRLRNKEGTEQLYHI